MSAARIVFAVLFFLVASLVFLPAPGLFFWQLKLVATEYGHWAVFGPLAVMLAGRRRSVVDSVSFGLAVIAGLLFLSSALQAMVFSGSAMGKMNPVFPAPTASAKGTPFSLLNLWFGRSPAPVEPQTVEFSEHEGTPLRLDLFRAQGRDNAPCVISLHGGGWERDGRDEFPALNHYLARRGYAVATIDYRLAPRWKWPAAREDALAALGYLKDHASEFGIDPQRFVFLGRSAGGQIVESVCAPGDVPGIVGCIALYAPADMKFAFDHAKKNDLLNSDKLIRQYMGGTPTDFAEGYATASAYGLANPRTPPTLLIHGANDELVWPLQSQRYAERLRSLEVRHVFLRPSWATHAMDYNFHGPGGQLTTWAIERFLASVTAPR